MFREPRFIINYDIKYCMGGSSTDGEDGEQEDFMIENNPGNCVELYLYSLRIESFIPDKAIAPVGWVERSGTHRSVARAKTKIFNLNEYRCTCLLQTR